MWLEPTAIFTFDDGYETVYSEALPRLAAVGAAGTVYVNSASIQDERYLTWLTAAECDAMYAAGWDIGNHTAHHLHGDAESAEDWLADVATCDAWLDGRGYERGRPHACYPWGEHNAALMQGLADAGVVTARTTTAGNVTVIGNDGGTLNLKTRALSGASPSLADAKGYIDTAVANREVIVFFAHNLVTSPPAGDYDPDGFSDIVAYAASSCRVLSMSQWYAAWQSESCPPLYAPYVPSQHFDGTRYHYRPDATMLATIRADAALRIAAQEAVACQPYISGWPNHA